MNTKKNASKKVRVFVPEGFLDPSCNLGDYGGEYIVFVVTGVSRRKVKVESFNYSVYGDETSSNYCKHWRRTCVERYECEVMCKKEFYVKRQRLNKNDYEEIDYVPILINVLQNEPDLLGVKEKRDDNRFEIEKW